MNTLTTCTLCPNPATRTLDDRALCESCADKAEAYQARFENRLTRLRAAAAKAEGNYQATHDRAHTMAQAIPFGQPIHIGHYSEGRDRRYRERIHKTFGRAFAHLERANQLAERAKAAESHTAIRSDDPLAMVKLQEKIAAAETEQLRMKTANAAIKRGTPKPYAAFELTNNAANIRRMKDRLKDLQAKQVQATAPDFVAEETHGAVRLVRNTEANRLQLIFPGKPTAEVIALLKSKGFIWSGKNGAWQRQLNNAAEWAAEQILTSISK